MASGPSQSTFVTVQQSYRTDPFKEMNGNWNVGLFSCCDDVSACKIIFKQKFYYYRFVFFQVVMHIFVVGAFIVH